MWTFVCRGKAVGGLGGRAPCRKWLSLHPHDTLSPDSPAPDTNLFQAPTKLPGPLQQFAILIR